ncbi:hypothetical protein Gpo141_00014074, partial [Globisporangium polare]
MTSAYPVDAQQQSGMQQQQSMQYGALPSGVPRAPVQAGGSAARTDVRYNRLVQRDIDKPMEAMRYFNAKVQDGKIPLVLIPKYPTLFSLFVQIPSGMHVILWVLKQKWNAHTGMMEPGLKIFWPA